MPVKTVKQHEGLIHRHNLSHAPHLDLTSPVWNLQDGQASEVFGLDVVSPNRFRPDRGRKPVGVSIPEGDRPLTCGGEFNASAWITTRLSGVIERTVGDESRVRAFTTDSTNLTYTASTGALTKGSGAVFNDYVYASGDVILIPKASGGFSGVVKILSKTDSDTIVIESGLPIVDGADNVPVAMIFRGSCLTTEIRIDVDDDGVNELVLIKSPDLYAKEGPWPKEVVGATVLVNEDRRMGSPPVTLQVKTRWSLGQENNAIVLDTAITGYGLTLLPHLGKVSIQLVGFFDHQGFWVSNGRKFWLQREGKYKLLLDLGDDKFLGTTWRMARIANNRMMLVSPDFAPRVLHLNRVSPDIVSEDEVLAGCIPPKKAGNVESYDPVADLIYNASWVMAPFSGKGGALTDGNNLRCIVRAVNLEDDLISSFVYVSTGVDVSEVTSDPTLDGVAADDSVSVVIPRGPHDLGAVGQTVLHRRMTHIEVWRTGSSLFTTSYHLESRMALADWEANESFADDASPFTSEANLSIYPINLSDADILGLPGLIETEFLAGGLPPVCRDIVSLLGVTLCFGRAAFTKVEQPVFSQGLFEIGNFGGDDLKGANGATTADNVVVDLSTNTPDLSDVFISTLVLEGTTGGDAGAVDRFFISSVDDEADEVTLYTAPNESVDPVNWSIRSARIGASASSFYEDYTHEEGDQYVVIGSGGSGNAEQTFPLGVYDILEGPFNTDKDIMLDWDQVLKLPLWTSESSSIGRIHGYVRRKGTINWPTIGSDEDVWFSRTDKFNPEGFPPRVLQLSRVGDTFRRAVVIGTTVVVIMDQGVHLLYKEGVDIKSETVAQFGSGTPWADSVLVIGNTVYWATPKGIQSVQVFKEPNVDGQRGKLNPLDLLRLSSWFTEAFNDGETIDAGFDSFHQTLRFRRKRGDHDYQTLQFSFLTKLWTLLEGDTGFVYVRSSVAQNLPQQSSLLYSVDSLTGGVFLVNNQDGEEPYGDLSQDTVDSDRYTQGAGILTRQNGVSFSPAMVGDIVRLFDVDGTEHRRTVLSSTLGRIEFDVVPGLDLASFIIGSGRFQVKFAPTAKVLNSTRKSLEGLTLRALPGDRGSNAAVTVKVFENLDSDPVGSQDIEVFKDSAPGKTTADRVASLEAQGTDLEVEISSVSTENDFDVEHLEAIIREDGDEFVDQDAD